VKEIRGRR